MREKIEQLIKASRIYAADQISWFARMLYAAQLVITERCPAPAGIDKHGRVYFNPKWIAHLRERCQDNQQALAQVGFLWFHELCHWIREHGQRAEEIHAQPALWNLATDMEINDYVPEGLQMPDFGQGPSGVLPHHYNLPKGHTAEWYYRHLQQQAQQISPSHTGQMGQAEATNTTPQPDAFPRLDEGSGIDGQSRAWELSTENEEAPALSAFDRRVLGEEVARRILDAHKTRGTIPAGWVRWAEEILNPRVDWRQQLLRAARCAISEGFGQRIDYSWRRPNRRSAVYAPLILPSLQGEYKPRVVCIVDTSGSIGQRELVQALAEVRGVLEQLRVPITIISSNRVPNEVLQVFTSSGWFKVHYRWCAYRSSEIVACLYDALEMKPLPNVVIILTDGHTPLPKTRPRGTRVIWGIWKIGKREPRKPPCPPWHERDIVIIQIEPELTQH